MDYVQIRMCSKNMIIISILLISSINFITGSTKIQLSDSNLRKHLESNVQKHREPRPKPKNEILGALNSKNVCMNVCNPPYYNHEFTPSYNGQYNPGPDQYNPGLGQQYPVLGLPYPGKGQNNLAGDSYEPAGWNQNYPSWGYGSLQGYGQISDPGEGGSYQSLGENQFFPEGSFGDYVAGCYRNMFRRRYKVDPGYVKPTIFNYKTLLKRNYENFRNGRNYNRDFMNCQLICYPVMMPSYTATSIYPSTTSESEETTEENTSTKKPSTKQTTKKKRKTKRHKGNTAV